MNRTTAILVALAALLGHILAIYQNVDGDFAPPFEISHVAYRAARNLVHEGNLVWMAGGTGIESYPSPLWVAVSAICTQLYIAPTTATQFLGIACALATVIVLAQFSTDRLAGLIALLLFVVTGTTAASAASGTEYPLVMLLMTAAFLSLERRSTRMASVLLCLTALARNEMWLMVAAMFAVELMSAKARRVRGQPVLYRAFLAPAILMLGLTVLRWLMTGTPITPTTRTLLTVDPERYRLGLDYLSSFYLRSGTATLVAFPLFYLVRGHLSGLGRRALALVLTWSLLMAALGGEGLPFWMGMAPVIPLIYVTIQEAMITAMDSRRPGLEPLTWVLFVLAILAAGLVSRVPTNIGGIPLREFQLSWMEPSQALSRTYRRPLGRRGLMQEIEQVEELRALGVFLRDRLEVGTTILSPWPGAIGYISRQDVIDLFGRASSPPDGSVQKSWYGIPRVSIPAALGSQPDYIVPVATSGTTPPRIGAALREWIERTGGAEEMAGTVESALNLLRDYEVVSIPVPRRSYLPDDTSPRPFYMLRNKKLMLQPRIEIEEVEGEFVIHAWHDGHQQIVDLEVLWSEIGGRELHLNPTGQFVEQDLVHARAGLLLHSTGQRPIQLMKFRLPAGADKGAIEAVLQNPNSEADPRFSMVSRRARLRVGVK